MPTLDFYRRQRNQPMTIGQHHKAESDMVVEATWYNDIDARIGWFYDQAHDDQFDIDFGMDPTRSHTKIPVDIKFFEIEYNSLSKDEVPYHITFKPSYESNIPYYEEMFAKKLGASFPVGLYCDIPNEKGVYHRWLVVGQYREHSNQFPSFLVLPTDFKLRWVYKNKKYESWSVLRSQSSYNAGTWTDYKVNVLPLICGDAYLKIGLNR